MNENKLKRKGTYFSPLMPTESFTKPKTTSIKNSTKTCTLLGTRKPLFFRASKKKQKNKSPRKIIAVAFVIGKKPASVRYLIVGEKKSGKS
jgi:hypothetical protein